MTNYISDTDMLVHNEAILVLKNLSSLENHLEHFTSIKSDKAYERLRNKIEIFLRSYEEVEKLYKKKCTNKKNKIKNFKKMYNPPLNVIKQHLRNDSVLNNILSIDNDNKYVKKDNSPHFAKRKNLIGIENVDFIEGSYEIGGQTPLIILRLNQGRCGFDDCDHALNFLLISIDNATINDLVVNESFWSRNDGGGECIITSTQSLRDQTHPSYISFSLNLSNGSNFINSTSSRLKHLLFGSNWSSSKHIFNPDKANEFVKSTRYHKFNVAVYKKIFQLIDIRSTDPQFKYNIVKCCRTSSVCEKVHIIIKERAPFLLVCDCGMQLCGKGCGKAYHGKFSCDESFDDSTKMLFDELRVCPCPNLECNIKIYKFEGCNHITCSKCRTEFCYMCGEQYEKNEYGHYMVDEHYRLDKCRQFDNLLDDPYIL